MVSVKHESSSQRLHHRLTIPLWVTIDGQTYRVKDWSLGGFAITQAEMTFKLEDQLTVDVKINFQGFTIDFSAQVKVVRISDTEKSIGFEYIELGEREQEILKYFSAMVISGKIVAFEDVLNKIDVPVTPSSLKPDTKPNAAVPLRRKPIMAIVRGVIYLVLGIIVTIIILKIFYAYFFRLEVTTAVVESPIESVSSPASGLFSKLYVLKDQLVIQGQPLFSVENINLEHSQQLAEVRVAEAKAQVLFLEKNLKSAEEKLVLYRIIAINRNEKAQSRLTQSQKQLQLEKNNLTRYITLANRGRLSMVDLNKLRQELAEKTHNLNRDRLDLQAQQQLVRTIKTGHFFSGDRVESNAIELKNQLIKAKKQVQNERKKVDVLTHSIAKLTIKAPFDGKVVNILISKGNMLGAGKTVMILEKNQQRVIHAYLTQDEISELILGSKVKIYVPATDKKYTGTIVNIDRTIGFLDEINERYRYRTTRDRSGLAVVTIDGMTIAQMRQQFPTGLPVVLSFQRRWLQI